MIVFNQDGTKSYICDFCNKHQNLIKGKIIAGSRTVSICEECVEKCMIIVNSEAPGVRKQPDNNGVPPRAV